VADSFGGTRSLFTDDAVTRILAAGAFQLPLQAADPGPTPRPAHMVDDVSEFTSFLEVIGGTYVEMVETKVDRRLARELSKLLSGAVRLRRTVTGKQFIGFLERTYKRAEYSFIPHASHDAAYLNLLTQMRTVDDALFELESRARDVKTKLKTARSAQTLVVLLAIVWQKWKGQWPGVSVDPESHRVHGPFVRFVHEVVRTLRVEFPNLPLPAAASIRATVRTNRLDFKRMALPAEK
jgi:hypothetical protein